MAKKKQNDLPILGLFIIVLLLLLGPVGWYWQKVGFSDPMWIEANFSQSIYPMIAQPISKLFGSTRFSFAEFICVTALIWIPLVIVLIFKACRKRKSVFASLAVTFTLILCMISSGYFGYMLLCGLNYARLPYANIAGYDVSPMSVEELTELTRSLAIKANDLRSQLNENAEGVYARNETLADISLRCKTNYELAGKNAPWLLGDYSAPKLVFLSEPWAYTKTTGMYFPFTVEANINQVNSDFLYASTMAHEAAHQRGFMREDEANFIAYYVCMHSNSIDDRYSGTMLALIHAGNALYAADNDAYMQVRSTFSQGVIRDLAAHNALWDKYDGKAAEVQDKVNDTYLKSNAQEDGVRSYGRMVDLLAGHMRYQKQQNQSGAQ